MLKRSHFIAALLLIGVNRTPAQDAYSKVQAVSSAVKAAMSKHGVPGVSVAVFREFQLEWARGYGVASLGGRQPVDTLTLFQAASISKPVVALAAMRLVEEQRLDLDRNVNDYLTSWKLPENEFTKTTPVTLRHLLSHTGGLTVHGFPGYAQGEAVPTLTQVLDGQKPANSAPVRVAITPGTKFEYSGGGYTILQQLLLDVTHLSFPRLMRAMVLDRLRMDSSTYEQPLPASLLEFATAGQEKGQVIAGERHTYPEMAAAGLWTTPSDLARFAMAIQRSRLGLPGAILSKELAISMTTASIPGSFGLGLELLRPNDAEKRFFGHTGGNFGYRCMLLATLNGGNGVAVMINGDQFEAVFEIVNATVAAYGW